jgi:cell division protein ZapA (FtsZ GTPase activity inhibitor)
VPDEQQKVWRTVRDARDAAVTLLKQRWSAKQPVTGADLDDATRGVIKAAGYGEWFVHRTGHSIDRDLHGSGPHIDNFETNDNRTLLTGVGFSIEPGIYLTGRFGMRSEINVTIQPDGPLVTPTVPQTDLVVLGLALAALPFVTLGHFFRTEQGFVTSPASSSDLDTLRQILFGAELARLEQTLAADRQSASSRSAEIEQKVNQAFSALEQKVERRLEELSQKVSGQLDEIGKRQQAHADKVTQLLDQVMAELGRRTDALTAETRAGMDESRARLAELEKKKLNVAEFGASLAALGQRFASGTDETGRR